MNELGLRRGDVVYVRSAAEILATLDERGRLDALPFMPEMISSCGGRFTVDRRAEIVCDTVNSNLTSRRLADTVFLDTPRCDGTGHDGCQAECRLYWKEAWLRRADDASIAVGEPANGVAELRRLVGSVTTNGETGDACRYRCQATELVVASERLKVTSPRPYLRELTTHNVSPVRWVKVMTRAAVMQPAQRAGLLKAAVLAGSTSTTPPAPPPLGLQPGDWVRVRPRDEIRATLNLEGRNRGLWFDREMLQFCGRTFRVRKRVTRIIDEPDGRMLTFTSDCIMLDDAVCSGERSTGRWFCAREIPCYWRESWLERVDPPAS